MSVTFETKKLPDGSTLSRRFEHGRLVSCTQLYVHPSGRHTTLRFDASNVKVEESHSVGIEILLTMTFKDGAKTSETYICKRRLVTRKTYEKRRAEYPDMPAADAGLNDSNAELLALVKEDRKKRLEVAAHEVDIERGRKLDHFCHKMIHSEAVENAFLWIDGAPNTLGEMSRSASRRLLSIMRDLGCPSVYACEVSSFDGKGKNAGGLVVELPTAPDLRVRVRAFFRRLAQRQGFDPYPDDGQRFEYAKLD